MGQGRGKGGAILEDALLKCFQKGFGVWGPGGFARVLEGLGSFWARKDRPLLCTITNERWPSRQHASSNIK